MFRYVYKLDQLVCHGSQRLANTFSMDRDDPLTPLPSVVAESYVGSLGFMVSLIDLNRPDLLG